MSYFVLVVVPGTRRSVVDEQIVVIFSPHVLHSTVHQTRGFVPDHLTGAQDHLHDEVDHDVLDLDNLVLLPIIVHYVKGPRLIQLLSKVYDGGHNVSAKTIHVGYQPRVVRVSAHSVC